MSDNILELFITSGPRVIVDAGEEIVSARFTASGGIEVVRKPGSRRYFVDSIDEFGEAMPEWDGLSYDEAMAHARVAAADLGGAPIIQRVRA